MANTSINLIGLDFDTLKNNFKTYLKNNTAFKDYNFDGSNMSVLLDVMSYNTYLNAFYLNMVASEMFLDSAQLRDSIVSHAKELNYLPRSYSSSRADVDITVNANGSTTSVLLAKGTSFTTRVQDTTFTFTTNQNIILTPQGNNVFKGTNITLYEGRYLAESFVYDTTISNQRFVLSNPTIDISSLTVNIIEDSGSETKVYTRALSLFGINPTSQVYFLQPAENGQYEIVFGDDVFGRRPKNGSAIIVEYRTSRGQLPNGASVFVNDGPIDGQTNVIITTVLIASSGNVAESADSIRYNAPRSVATQERAVTATDYETLLTTNFPEIQSLSVYGGEDVTPPEYGKVFISVDIASADGVPDAAKQQYYDYIKSKTPLTITPVFIDPEFLYVDVDTTVRYNVNISQKQISEMITIVQAAINDFSVQNIEKFKATLRYSQLCTAIDSSDSSIISNDTRVRALKYLNAPELKFNQIGNYTIQFNIPLTQEYYLTGNQLPKEIQHTIESSSFTYNDKKSFIKDVNNQLAVVQEQENSFIVVKFIGEVDYDTGTISLNDFNPSDAPGGRIKFYAVPRTKDIFSNRNIVLKILESDININIERVRE
jgi:hypothetical protein